VHDEASGANGVERVAPPCTNPLGGHRHIRLPQRIVAGNPGLYPEVVARAQEDRSPAAPAPDDGHARFVGPHRVDHLWALCAPEHDGGLGHPVCHSVPDAQRPELLHVEERM
jgi:hypothetical protein